MSSKGRTSCWRQPVLRGWIQLALEASNGNLQLPSVCVKCCVRWWGRKPPNNNPTSQRAQHKALRTAVHHTASGTHGTCLHVCLCPRQAMYVYAVARVHARIDVHLRACECSSPTSLFLSSSDFNHSRLNPASFHSDPK